MRAIMVCEETDCEVDVEVGDLVLVFKRSDSSGLERLFKLALTDPVLAGVARVIESHYHLQLSKGLAVN